MYVVGFIILYRIMQYRIDIKLGNIIYHHITCFRIMLSLPLSLSLSFSLSVDDLAGRKPQPTALPPTPFEDRQEGWRHVFARTRSIASGPPPRLSVSAPPRSFARRLGPRYISTLPDNSEQLH